MRAGKVCKDKEISFGWKEHLVRHGDGKGNWLYKSGEFRFLHYLNSQWVSPFGLAQMDNGEVILVGAWFDGKKERAIAGFSKDKGESWSEWRSIPDSKPSRLVGLSRPHMLAYLGKGALTFVTEAQIRRRCFSSDYGRTWEHIPAQPASNGLGFYVEGNPMVDRDASGTAVRIAEVGFNVPEGEWPRTPCDAFLRWSEDGGRTWVKETKPDAWRIKVEHEGKYYERSVCEGSLVRAKNGWLVAALRTDLLPRYYAGEKKEGRDFDDSLCGAAVSVSKDDGQTWSPLKTLYDAGRHHAQLQLLPDGDILMVHNVRVDVRGGELVSYRRGCEAVTSHDNGLTWDLNKKYILDEYEFYDGVKWFNGECGRPCMTILEDGQILTAYSKSPGRIGMIRWNL